MADNGAERPAAIPSSARIAGFTGWNLFGFCAPMVVAFFSIPLFIDGLGADRFGALTLVWMLVGYFSILDFGMGRAMTKMSAHYLGVGREREMPGVFWTALWMMTALGVAGMLALIGASGWLAGEALHIPAELREEVRRSFLVVSVGLPVTVMITGLIGMLETHQHFKLINLVRVPLGIATYAAPLAVLPFTNSLVWVVSVLIAVRVIEFAIFFGCCLGLIPALRRTMRWDVAQVRPMLTFGGWMTVSNVALPLMIHIDRFVIGAARTLTEVAYYANPAEIVVKFLILPRALVSAMFPPMTMHLARGSREADALFGRAVKLLVLLLFPAALALYTVAPEFLELWLGSEFAGPGGGVLRWLTAGILVYGMTYLPFSLLQSAGRPDVSAKWHVLELPLFLAAAWWATGRWGITGMAVAWGVRGLMDVAVLFPAALRHVPEARPAVVRSGVMLLSGLAILAGVGGIEALAWRLAAALAGVLVFAGLGWSWLLTAGEREACRAYAARRGKKNAG